MLKWGRCLCATCRKKGKMGTTTRPTPQNPVVKILCEDCTLQDLSLRHRISIKEAKKKHERSAKTQSILAKIIVERFQEETGKKIPKKLDAIREVLQPGMEWWNNVSESEKNRIEEMSKDEQKEYFRKAPLIEAPKVPIVREDHTGRNDPCSCGSGKKYKKCCLGKIE